MSGGRRAGSYARWRRPRNAFAVERAEGGTASAGVCQPPHGVRGGEPGRSTALEVARKLHRDARVDATDTHRADDSGGQDELEALRAALVNAQRMILEVEADGERARAEMERLRQASGQPGLAVGDAPTVGVSLDERLLVVFDADPTWEDASRSNHRVALVPPHGEAPMRLGTLGPGRVLANLAASGALAALAAARAAGCRQPFFGCLAAPGSLRVLPLGRIDVAAGRPLDAAAVAAQLADRPRGTRVLAVGADAESLIRLRQMLTRVGLSVSIAWDAK